MLKKNMSRSLYIFAFGTLLSVSYTSGVGSAPATKFIIDEFRNGICPSSLRLYNSSYMSNCAKIVYPSELSHISENNSNTFLCLGLYDISYRICYFESRNPNFTVLPNDHDLDLQMKKLVQSSNNPSQFCEQQESWKYSPLYNKTQQAVSMLTIAFKDSFQCERICFDFTKKFNLLCAIWVWATQLPEISTFDQQNSMLYNNLNLASSIKNKSNKNDQTSHDMSSAAVSSSISKSEVIKNGKNKQNKKLPSGKENDSETLVNDYESKIPSKDNGRVQASTTSLSGAVQNHQDSEIEIKSSNVDKIHENSNTKSESPKDNTNKKFEGLEKSAGSTTDGKNVFSSQKMESTGASINQSVTLLQNTDDPKNFHSEDLSEDHAYGTTEDGVGVVQDPSTSGPSLPKPSKIKDTLFLNPSIRTEDDSHFFTYFVVITFLCIGGYVGYHNKQKILAFVLEGRRSRGSRGRRRPNTASYRKLDCTLEEAVNSQCNSNVTHVIY
ncbi:trans-Golgi network integral membrane protein 2 isoform X2 [Cephus cinctus]|uniref:Trans-Golgi network integral membrane protein 2 isoform X2 n=1 Tax=Cephus cinctus TaxID=211228 RepID=A0AAJ7FSG0_CEPCN|nr:trans-Golgi network integral membrane protein 2 isoform X2 [Cephus cinctus]